MEYIVIISSSTHEECVCCYNNYDLKRRMYIQCSSTRFYCNDGNFHLGLVTCLSCGHVSKINFRQRTITKITPVKWVEV